MYYYSALHKYRILHASDFFCFLRRSPRIINVENKNILIRRYYRCIRHCNVTYSIVRCFSASFGHFVGIFYAYLKIVRVHHLNLSNL